MMTHDLVGRHPEKGLERVIGEDLLHPRLHEISVIPNTGRSRRGLLFPFVYSRLLLKRCDFFQRSSRASRPRWYSDIGNRSSRKPLIHDTNPPLLEGRERLILLCPHFRVHILIEFCRHLYKRKEGKLITMKKRKERRRLDGIILTLLFNGYGSKNKSRRVWTKAVTS